MPETQRDFPSLAGVGSRLKPAWIYRWLLHPRGEWSAASMPALLGDPSDPVARKRAADLTAYLIGLRTTQRDSAVPPVAASAASERSVESSPRSVSQTDANAKPAQPRDPHSAELGERLYEQLGCIACHTLRGDASGTSAAGDERIPLEHVTRKFQPAALSRYLAAPHTDHAWSAMPDFQLDRREAESLADYLFQAVPMDGEENDGHVAGDSAVGRDLFLSLGCAACHTDGEMDHSNRLTESGTPVRTGIDARGIDRGCLAPRENENRRGPCYELAETDRRALGMFITTGGTSLEHRSEYEFAERSFVRLRCGACHARDGVADRRSKLVLEEGVTGQPPEPIPSLTWAGEKLRGTWTHRLLAGELDYPARPWLAARMPVFPVVAEALAHGLALEHGLPPVDDQESFPVSAELAEQGRRLTLKDGGLDCRLCHAARDEVLPLENRSWGIGLANISDRLRREFYLHWMLDPLRIDPATKMPKFSADRQWTEARDILDGEALPQFEAIWHYLHSPAVRRTHESEELLGR